MIANVVSIRAQASAIPEVAGVVTKVIPFNPGAGAAAGGAALGSQIFGYVLGGLGLVVTLAQTIDLMNRYSEFTGELETSIYYYPDGSWSFGVDMGFVERVKMFLWNEGIVSYALPDDAVMNETMRNEFNTVAAHKHAVCWFWDGNMYFAYNDYAKMRIYNSNPNGEAAYYLDRPDGGSFYRFYVRPDGSTYFTETLTRVRVYATSWFWFGSADNKEIVSVYELGHVAPLELPIPEGYPEWYANARPATNPDTQEEITILPIPLNPSADPDAAPDTLTQPDIWQGSIADPMPDSGTDTNPDTGTDPDTPGAPSTDIGDYQIDLKQFFPFCIPFDLYDFFMCLNADPVAPVIEWVIPLPGGDTYPLVIDLSAFDDVAQLLRRLQLLLFCVGLAFKTRDLIKG